MSKAVSRPDSPLLRAVRARLARPAGRITDENYRFRRLSVPLAVAPPAPITPLREAAPAPAPAAAPRPLDRHPAAVYLAGLAPGARRTQASALTQIARLLGRDSLLGCAWHELRYPHTAAVRAQLQERYAPATANRMLAALRRVLEEAWRLGLMDRETCERACDLPPIRGEALPAGRAIARAEIASLLDATAAGGPVGVRDAALIGLLYATGLRRSELSHLDLADVDLATGAITVAGKGRKRRVVYLADAAERLADYLVIRGDAAGPLFYRARRGGHLEARRLSDQGVRDVLSRVAAVAGVTDVRPHDFRRTFISDLLDAGADMASAQRLAGHADPATTSRYDRRGERATRRAASLLTLPRRTLPLD